MGNSNRYADIDNEAPIGTLDLYERHNERRTSIITYSIVIIALSVFYVLYDLGFSKNGPNKYLLTIIILVGFLLLTFAHEGFHFIFQWIFSRKKPKVGFKWPHPYSALAAGVRVTRNQAILFSLAPLLCITPLLIISLFFISNLFRLIIITIGLFEVASCSADFLTVNWLFKYPKKTWLENVNFVNTLFPSPRKE